MSDLFRAIIIFWTLFSLACTKSELPKFNLLNSLRVIALTTPTPEVAAGDLVTITPVISDINSAVGLTDSAYVCLDLGVAYGAQPTCQGNLTKITIHENRVLTLPGLGSSWTGDADTFNLTIPLNTVIFAGRSAQEQFNGVNYLVEYILKNTNGQEIRSFRRIIVSTKSPKNLNPVITDIFSDGVTMTTLPLGSKVNLTSDLSMTSAESYQVQDFNNVITSTNENISVTWMITDGETKYFRSEVGTVNVYTGPDAAPVGRSAYIFAVARDNRAGVTVLKRQF